MSNNDKVDFPAFNISLGKLLAAAAWVDGTLSKREVNCLQTIILQLPYITFDDWRKLKIYLAYPITRIEQESIFKDFLDKVYHKGHCTVAWQALLAIINSDGVVTHDEKVFARELDTSMAKNCSSFLKKLRFFFLEESIRKQNAWPQPKTGRDKFIHEFFENPVYFLFRKAILKEKVELSFSKQEYQKICLISAVLCYVANEDGRIDLTEREFIHDLLVEEIGLPSNVAHLVVRISLQIDINEFSLRETCKSLRNSCKDDEVKKIFSLMVRLSFIDDKMNSKEIEILRIIAVYLEISQETWIETVFESKNKKQISSSFSKHEEKP